MARTRTTARQALETFLVEHYRPGLTVDELGAWAVRVRETAHEMEREGKSVRYLRATIVPGDEPGSARSKPPGRSAGAASTPPPANSTLSAKASQP